MQKVMNKHAFFLVEYVVPMNFYCLTQVLSTYRPKVILNFLNTYHKHTLCIFLALFFFFFLHNKRVIFFLS